MRLLANELSIHAQFNAVASFEEALQRIMAMRETAEKFGREIHCHRAISSSTPIKGRSMQNVIANIADLNRRRLALIWFTRNGPFWDDIRTHDDDDWLECQNEIITGSAVGEAAYRTMHGVETSLVSVTPSNWENSPLNVTWKKTELDIRTVGIVNWLNERELRKSLEKAAPPIRSWQELHQSLSQRFENLVFSANCFEPLVGMPFSKSSSDRLLALCNILERCTKAFDASGRRSSEGHEINETYFRGDRAWFTDSSDSEKHSFRNTLTFPHPAENGKYILCSWHGKVSHLTLRLHYSWSGRMGDPVFIVYVGPKLTRR